MSTKVLIVDDSALVCMAFARALQAHGDIVVRHTAQNGRRALELIARDVPDLVLLDVDMPEMDGLATLREIKARHPRLPVIMFSSLTERGASTTFRALSLGATDYLAKPDGTNNGTGDTAAVARELAAKIRALTTGPQGPDSKRILCSQATTPAAIAADLSSRHLAKRRVAKPVELVVIAISTGGPTALARLLSALPADFPVPILIAQHMPPMFSRQMARHLDRECALRVAEAEQGTRIGPGEVWVAPGDYHMYVDARLSGTALRLDQSARMHGCRPAADLLFRSAAESVGGGVLAVVMTGMGRDGAAGAQRIAEAGGGVLAQDEATSVVWGMPGTVVAMGLANEVLPLDEIAPALVRLTRRTRVGGSSR